MTIRELQEIAKPYGIYVKGYNAGGNPQYKVGYEDRDYFAMRDIFRATTLKEVSAFVDGFAQAKDSLKPA